jgi:hypothetical protein
MAIGPRCFVLHGRVSIRFVPRAISEANGW